MISSCPCIYAPAITFEQTGGYSYKFCVSLMPLQAFPPLYSLVFCHKKYEISICANLVTLVLSLALCKIQYSSHVLHKYSYAHLCVCGCVCVGGGVNFEKINENVLGTRFKL
jgi:hypothetical protein